MKLQMSTRRSLAIGVIAAACLLGILNSGGYRYGISDQAFYLPAVIQHLDSSLFPRDRALLHAQDRFMLFDDGAAAMVKTTGLSVPTLFLAVFLVGLVVHFAGCVELGRRWYRSWWSVAALAFILTMRHRITLTGANTLEGYLHPRSLAFAVGVWALVAFLSGRTMIAIAVVALAGALHTTTALWFAIWIGIAIVVADARWRWPLAIATAAAAAAGIWLLWFGPMREQLQQMDMRWVSVLALKDYLFPTEWPVSAWLINLAYPLIVWTGYRVRAARSVAHPREKPLVFGALALAVVFLLSLPFVLMRVALAVQLQVSRVFWMLELMATLYLIWMAIEWAPKTSRRAPVRRWVTVAVALAAVSRGVYIMQVEQAGRSIIQVRVPEDQWTDVMRWLRSTPPQTHVLADPNHAFRYGTSERVLGERDVLLEGSKDTALAIYSRAAAERVIERIQAVGDFDALQPETIRALAAKYNLDYMITERRMALPRVYENGRFTVYVLEDSSQ
jgi:hypothetical protein